MTHRLSFHPVIPGIVHAVLSRRWLSDWHGCHTSDPGQCSVISLTWQRHHLEYKIYPAASFQFGFMEIDKGKSINYTSVREEENKWRNLVTLGKLEEERAGNETSLQTGI